MMAIADQLRKEGREQAREEYQHFFQDYKKEIANALAAKGITLQEIGGDLDFDNFLKKKADRSRRNP